MTTRQRLTRLWRLAPKGLRWLWKHARRVLRTVLRFFNLLEPDLPYMVLSLSKLSVWLTLGLTGYVVTTGQGMTEIGAALIANVGSVANYAYRRKLQVETQTGGYGGPGMAFEAEPFPQPDFPQPGFSDPM